MVDITKVQGVVIDLDTAGSGSGGGVIMPTPELVEKFDIGDVWLTHKRAESYYDPEYIASLDNPHPVTKDGNFLFWDTYKTPIDFDARVTVTPVLDLGTTSSTIADTCSKFAGYNGGHVLIRQKTLAFFMRDGVATRINPSNTSYTVPDFNYLTDFITGDQVWYGASDNGIYTSLNPEVSFDNIYRFEEAAHDYHIYIEGNNVYVLNIYNKYARCVFIQHGNTELEPFILWEKDLSQYMDYTLNGLPRLHDEIFLRGSSVTTAENFAIHKLNIKTGFVEEDFINKDLVENIKNSLGMTDYSVVPAYATTVNTTIAFDTALVEHEKNIVFSRLFYLNNGSVIKMVSLRFSRERGIEILFTDSLINYPYYSVEGGKHLIKAGSIFKDLKYGITDSNTIENATQEYDGFTILDRDQSSGISTSIFYGNYDDTDKSYVIAREVATNKYFICEMNIENSEGYADVSYIPAITSIHPDLQYYMRIK